MYVSGNKNRAHRTYDYFWSCFFLERNAGDSEKSREKIPDPVSYLQSDRIYDLDRQLPFCSTGDSDVMIKEEIKEQKRRIKGYMTVEAAFVMPMVLCVFVILIYTSFYLYDRCVFKQDAFVLCFRESIRKEEGAPRVDPSYMQQGEARQFENKYFAVNDLETSAKAMGKKAVFQGSARVLPTSFGSYFLMPKSIWRLTFYGSARKTDPPWSIRSYRRKTYVVKKGLKALESIAGADPE